MAFAVGVNHAVNAAQAGDITAGTIIVGMLVLGSICIIIRSLLRRKRMGISLCGCSCETCSGCKR